MSRLLVFLFAFALTFLGSCSKTRNVHFDAVMLSNTNIKYLSFLGVLKESGILIYFSNLGIERNFIKIHFSTGERCLITQAVDMIMRQKKKI